MQNKKGFTLMEMMVVVLIIASLAAIAYPTYSKVITKARVAEAISLGEIVREAQQRYRVVNGGNYFSKFTNSHINGRTRLIKSSDVIVENGQLKKGDYTVSLMREKTSPKGSCIKVEYMKQGVYVFFIQMLVEDS